MHEAYEHLLRSIYHISYYYTTQHVPNHIHKYLEVSPLPVVFNVSSSDTLRLGGVWYTSPDSGTTVCLDA